MQTKVTNPARECTVQVWHAQASTEAAGVTEHVCESYLLDDERASANRYRQATSRNQHVIGRGMARRLLGSDSVAPTDIGFGYEDYGKPYVESPTDAKRPFNVAHTNGLVLCGLGDANAIELIGVDVESLARRTSTELAERFFAAPEIASLRRRPDSDQKRFFLRIWTLKEAFIKAIGTGLRTPLADFAFHDIDSDNPGIEFLDPGLEDERTWQFFCFEPRPGFVAASAICPLEGYRARIDCRRFEKLVSE